MFANERTTNAARAQGLWSEFVDREELLLTVEDLTVNGYQTRICYLIQGDSNTRGIGKGKTPEDIHLSAGYEALEYHLTGIHHHNYSYQLLSIEAAKLQYPIIPYRCDEAVFNDALQNDTVLPWVIYKDVSSAAEYAVPLASVDLSYSAKLFEEDTFDYHQHHLFAASNGIASGCTFEEAVTHAALEVIERDATSFFTIDTFVLNKPMLVLRHESLPESIQGLIKSIEQAYSDKLIICEMPTKFGAKVYCAAFTESPFLVQPHGCGASLMASYALERAIYEAVQIYNLVANDQLECDFDIEAYKSNHLFQQSIEFKLQDRVDAGNTTLIDFIDNSAEFSTYDDKQYLSDIIALVEKESSLLINTVTSEPDGLTCVRVIIPQAEEFFLISHCLLMMPKQRTKEYIHTSSGIVFDWANYQL